MTSCASCDKTILFGRVDERELRCWIGECLQAAVVRSANQIPDFAIAEHAHRGAAALSRNQ